MINNISVVVLTKNEDAGIGVTLSKLVGFRDVVVVDSQSTDRTLEICRQHGVRIVNFEWDGAYPKKKQWSLENAGVENKWVLLLDADEYPTSELMTELDLLSKSPILEDHGAFDINLLYKFSGKFLKHGHRVTKRSLVNREVTRFPEVNDLSAPGIREVEGHYQPETKSSVGVLRSKIIHDDRDPVSSWFDRHNRYSGWEAHLRMSKNLRQRVASARTSKGKLFDSLPFKPLIFFIYSFFIRLGFLDGRAGFDYAFALSSYYWQISLKVRELQRDADSLGRTES